MTDLSAKLDAETPELAELRSANARLTEAISRRDVKIDTQERAIKKLVAERDAAVTAANYVEQLRQGSAKPPKWMAAKQRRKDVHHATVGLMLSDLHLDEVVKPEEMRWVNAFDRDIAEQRFQRVIETTILLTGEFFAGLHYDGAVVLWAGDVFSGIIHEELRETNAASMMKSLHYWEPIVAGAFERLASVYGRLHVPVTVGNHGRRSEKWRAKGRAEESFEWLFASNIRDHHFKGSKTVTFDIPESFDTHVNVYSHRLHLEHGDNFKGGSGIAGAMSPLLLGVHRTTRQAIGEERMFQNAADPAVVPVERMFDVMALGHWHQYIVAPSKGLIVNGSLKGYDEYARAKKFEPELAQQAMWLWTPEHGISFAAPIIAQNREAEGW
jgi:hypothetical protein